MIGRTLKVEQYNVSSFVRGMFALLSLETTEN